MLRPNLCKKADKKSPHLSICSVKNRGAGAKQNYIYLSAILFRVFKSPHLPIRFGNKRA
jgi:hypothetical protein